MEHPVYWSVGRSRN